MAWQQCSFALALVVGGAGVVAGQPSKAVSGKNELPKLEAKKDTSKKDPIKKDAPDPKPVEGKQPTDPPKKGAPDKTAAGGKAKFPPGAIVVLVDELKDILSAVPKMIFIRLDDYQAMQDEIRALKARLKQERQPPSSCKLAGRVEGDFVLFQVDVSFKTDEPNRTVFIGLHGGHLTDEGRLDGQPALLDHGPDGFFVQVEGAGYHQLAIKLKLPLKRTGTPGSVTERGFDLGLPGAAVTLLSLDTPPGVQEIRWNEQGPLKWQPGMPKGRWDLTLGKMKHLALSWKERVLLPGTGPLLTADGKIVVKIEDNQVATTAELNIADLRGQTQEFQLLLPPQARVSVRSPAGLVKDIVPPDSKSQFHIVQLTEKTFERVQVEVQANQPRPASVNAIPIGPIAMVGAYKQRGTILVRAQPEALRGRRWSFQRHGDVYQREVPPNLAGPDVLALFEYEDMPGSGKSMTAKTPVPLELVWKNEKGQVETTVEHQVQLAPVADAFQAEVTSRIRVKSLTPGIDFVDVQLPRVRVEGVSILGFTASSFPACVPWAAAILSAQKYWPVAVPAEFVALGTDGAVAEMLPADASRRARITLGRSGAREFTVVLTGRYFLPGQSRSALLELPRPLGMVDRGAKLTVIAKDGVELVSEGQARETAPGEKQQTTSWDQSPEEVPLAWRPRLPEFPAESVTDISTRGKSARVRHQLRLEDWRDAVSGRSEKEAVLVRVPQTVRYLTVAPKNRLVAYQPDQGMLWIRFPEQGRGEDAVILEYDFSLADSGQGPGFAVPLLWPEKTTRIDAKIRIWCDATVMPALVSTAGDFWRERGAEVVAGHDTLPALVLRGAGAIHPLFLQFAENSGKLPVVVIDRGLMQVSISDDGHAYRARFLVRKFNAEYFDMRVPAPGLVQSVIVGKERINVRAYSKDDGQAIRIPINPDMYPQPVILDVEYKLTPPSEGERTWYTTVAPPQFLSDVYLGPLRWHLLTPSDWVTLPGGSDTQLEYTWSFENGLFTPQAAMTVDDLERWLTGSSPSTTNAAAGLVFWRSALEPLAVWHFSRQAWLLLCSGGFLAVGLAIGLMISSTRWPLGIMLVLIAMAGLGLGFLWPALVPMLAYGCQPGLAVLALVLLVQWLLQERYRRQVVFMPGFSRVKSNSSFVRGGGKRPPSTVDAPPPSKGSSQVGSSVSQVS